MGVPQIFAKFLGGKREDSLDWFPVTLICSPFAKICGTPVSNCDAESAVIGCGSFFCRKAGGGKLEGKNEEKETRA